MTSFEKLTELCHGIAGPKGEDPDAETKLDDERRYRERVLYAIADRIENGRRNYQYAISVLCTSLS
jgi:hypothetical protein